MIKIACDLINKSGKTIKLHFSLPEATESIVETLKDGDSISVFAGPNGTYQTITFLGTDDEENKQ